jgi:hypothetical protein
MRGEGEVRRVSRMPLRDDDIASAARAAAK